VAGGWSRSKLFAYWYASIGAGFVLLAVHRIVIGEAAWLIVLRVIIGAGFFALAWMQWRGMFERK
jgi:hypothetical protein